CSWMDAATSRRKQSRPARIDGQEDNEDDVSEKSAPGSPRSHNGDGDEGVVQRAADESESSPIEIRAAGTVLGPVRVRRLASPLDSTKGAIATLLDASGNAIFFEVSADESLLTTVRPTASLEDANCVVMEEAPDSLRLMMTKSVPLFEELIALFVSAPSIATEEERSGSRNGGSEERVRQRAVSDAAADEVARIQVTPKKHLCDQCGLVSFNSIDNLRAHQSSYCIKKDVDDATRARREKEVAPAPPPAPPSSFSMAAFLAASAAASAGLAMPRPLHFAPNPQQLLAAGLLLPPPAAASLLSTPVMPAPLPHTSPNVIYLPIGYHDIPAGPSGSVVQMLGQPQTIVPIAVPRPITGGAPLLPHLASSLSVTPAMCGAIPIPASLQFMAGDVITTIPVMATPSAHSSSSDSVAPSLTPHAPLRVVQQNNPKSTPKRRQSGPGARQSPALDLSSPALKRRRTHTENERTSPIEAGKHSSSSSASSSKCSPHRLTPQSPAIAATSVAGCSPSVTPGSEAGVEAPPPPTPRPFPCACGIGFSTEATLLAHVTTYCKLTPRSSDENGGAGKEQKRPPPSCVQCGFQPNSASQLAVHMRNHHAEAFICNLCGYRGFSVRGIRSHLRTHPELDSVRFDDLLGLHVTRSAYSKGRVHSEGTFPPVSSPVAPEVVKTLIDA
ncbi:hypothetical protein PMAYCL1PPCAC_25121, partial [Pristionchus mayeri]